MCMCVKIDVGCFGIGLLRSHKRRVFQYLTNDDNTLGSARLSACWTTTAWLKTVTSSSTQGWLYWGSSILIQQQQTTKRLPLFFGCVKISLFSPPLFLVCWVFFEGDGTAQDHHHKSIQWAPQEPLNFKNSRKKKERGHCEPIDVCLRNDTTCRPALTQKKRNCWKAFDSLGRAGSPV